MPKPFIAAYLRVSGTRQRHDSQEPDVDRWLAANAADSRVQRYRDTASGKTMERPAWQRVEAQIDRGNISTLLIWRLDRLGRTAAGLTTLFEKLQRQDVELVSIKDGLSLSTAAGRLMSNVLASVAAFENEVRSERVLAGQAVARSKGKKIGGGRAGRLITLKPEQIEMVCRLHGEGVSKAAIARATGLSRPWVYEILKREGLHTPGTVAKENL